MGKVAITGMGCMSPYGSGITELIKGIETNKDCFLTLPIKINATEYSDYPVGLVSLEKEDEIESALKSQLTPLSYYAYASSIEALKNSNITQEDTFYSDIGVSISSSMPSYSAYEELQKYINDNPRTMPTSMIFKTMNHSPAIQTASMLNLKGKCISNSSACASGLQSIISGYELIKQGKSKIMLCGGTEEYSAFLTFVFRKLGIASKTGCKPFDINRDGIVVSEGAGILVLENLDHARARGATIYAEILGSGYNTSTNTSYSDIISITECMKEAMKEASVTVNDTLFLINAHATGTKQGDTAEGQAISSIFQDVPPVVNSLKGYFGHTMAASGAIELITSILGLRKHTFYKTKGCETYDINCGDNLGLDEQVANSGHYTLMKNSIGLGGTNTSLILNVKAF